MLDDENTGMLSELVLCDWCARAQLISQCVDARQLNVPTKWSQVVANHTESYKGHA